MRLKDVAHINRRVLPEATDPNYSFRYIDISAVNDHGRITMPDESTSFVTAPSRARRVAPSGSTVVSTVRTYLRAISQVPHTREPLVFSTGFAVLEAKSHVDDRFLSYVCQSQTFIDEVVARSVGVSYPAINPSDLGCIEVALPPFDGQRRIADFLDAETARIAALAAIRSLQISALSELEVARIGSHLSGADITRGRIRTGWPWLPSIPEAWNIGPVYAYYDARLGKMLNADRASGDDKQPYLRNANIHWYEIDTEDLARMTFEPAERFRYSVQAGDLLVCEGGAGVAEAAVWDGRTSTCFYQKSLHRVRATSSVPVEWLMYWLRFAKASGVFEADGNIATIPHLTGEQLTEYRIPVPSDGHSRVAELSLEIAAIRRAQQVMATANATLAERRRALITAAVTGQIDVTTADGLALAGGAA